MTNITEKLLKGFTEFCEEIVSQAYVITNGRTVASVVLDHDVAIKLCQLVIRKTSDQNFKVASMEDATELAYRTGYDDAIAYMKELQMSNEPQDGEVNGEDQKL